jgi:uncharacterized membrane protein required for colicin V production
MEALLSWLNPFDFLIALALLGGIALGFIRGLVRMALSLLVLYIAMVLAMTFYTQVGRWIGFVTTDALPERTLQSLAFVIILILTTAIINFVLHRTYRDTELPGVRQIDQLGGMIVGFLLVSTWIGLAIIALGFVLKTAVAPGTGTIRANMLYFFNTSFLIPIFYHLLPIVLATLRPWMPKGLPPEIFSLQFF